MVEESKHDDGRPNRVKFIIEEVANECDKQHNFHKSEAVKYAYSRDLFRTVAGQFDGVSDSPQLASVESTMLKLNEFVKAREAETKKQTFDVSSVAYVTATSATSVIFISSYGGSSNIEIPLPKPFPAWKPEKNEEYSKRLAKLDPELGRLYLSIWDEFYGGTGSAERAALVSMRQLVDHLFDKLAPDELVRKSKFYQTNSHVNNHQVFRRERLTYAIHTHVKDIRLRDLLIAETETMLQCYKDLNMLHEHGSLNRENTYKTLMTMQKLIEQWIDAISI